MLLLLKPLAQRYSEDKVWGKMFLIPGTDNVISLSCTRVCYVLCVVGTSRQGNKILDTVKADSLDLLCGHLCLYVTANSGFIKTWRALFQTMALLTPS